MQNLRGISGKRFEVLHNALNEEIKAEKIKKNSNDILKLGTISRIDKNKSISTLISAVSQLKTAGYKVFFEIIGDGPELKNLKRQSSKQGLTDNDILFRGFVEGDVDDYLVDFDIFFISNTINYSEEIFPVLGLKIIIFEEIEIFSYFIEALPIR